MFYMGIAESRKQKLQYLCIKNDTFEKLKIFIKRNGIKFENYSKYLESHSN